MKEQIKAPVLAETGRVQPENTHDTIRGMLAESQSNSSDGLSVTPLFQGRKEISILKEKVGLTRD